jgi:hypothetical protein
MEKNFWESGERKHLVFASFINKKWKKVGFYGGKCKTYIIEKGHQKIVFDALKSAFDLVKNGR